MSIECATKVIRYMSIWVQLKGFAFYWQNYSEQELLLTGETSGIGGCDTVRRNINGFIRLKSNSGSESFQKQIERQSGRLNWSSEFYTVKQKIIELECDAVVLFI